MNKLEKAVEELRQTEKYISRLEIVNTALPKKKAEKFDKLLKPLYAKSTMLRVNIQQKLMKVK